MTPGEYSSSGGTAAAGSTSTSGVVNNNNSSNNNSSSFSVNRGIKVSASPLITTTTTHSNFSGNTPNFNTIRNSDIRNSESTLASGSTVVPTYAEQMRALSFHAWFTLLQETYVTTPPLTSLPLL